MRYLLSLVFKNKIHFRLLHRSLFLFYLFLPAQSIALELSIKDDPITAWPLVLYKPAESLDILWPLYHYTKNDDTTRYALRPFFYSLERNTKSSETKMSILWPFISQTTSPKIKESHVFPLWWDRQTEKKSHRVLFPFYWKGHNSSNPNYQTRYFHLWPFYGVNSTPLAKEHSILYPFFRAASNNEQNYRELHIPWPIWGFTQKGEEKNLRVLPFYFSASQQNSEKKFVFPYYWATEDNTSTKGLLPIWYSSQSPNHSENWLFPFYYRYRSPIKEISFITPFFAWEKNGQRNQKALFPIWYQKTTEQSSLQILFPLYASHVGDKKNDHPHSRKYIFPTYFSETKKDRRQRMLLPIAYSFANEQRDLDFLFPLYLNSTTREQGNEVSHLRFITPLYNDGSASIGPDRKRSHSMLLPFLYQYKFDYQDVEPSENKRFELTAGVPFYFDIKTKYSQYKSFFPFYYHSLSSDGITEFQYYFPLYGQQRKNGAVLKRYFLFPLYAHHQSEDRETSSWDALWPLLHQSKSPEKTERRALPFYYSQDTEHSRFSAVIPFYFHYQSKEGLLDQSTGDPLEWSNNVSFNGLLPFYGHYQRGDWYQIRSFLGPIYLRIRDQKNQTDMTSLAFPFHMSLKNPDSEKWWLLPFFYSDTSRQNKLQIGSLAFLPPYYYRSENTHRKHFHIWPLYGKLTQGTYTETSFIWPLIRFGADTQRKESMTQALLYYSKKTQLGHTKVLFPLGYSYQDKQQKQNASLFLHWYNKDLATNRSSLSLLWLWPNHASLFRYEAEQADRSHGLFPLYSYQHFHRKSQEQQMQFYFPWPLFSHNINSAFIDNLSFLWKVISFEKSPSSTEFRFLWRFIRTHKSEKESTLEVNPFYYSHQDEQGKYTAILGGLYSSKTAIDGTKKRKLFWIIGL